MKTLEWTTHPDSIMSDTLLGYFEITENQEKFSVDLWNDYGDHETFNDKKFASQQEAKDFCQYVYYKNAPKVIENIGKALHEIRIENIGKALQDQENHE